MTIRHILCPVDISETSEFALTYAAVLAGELGATITALHVDPILPDVFPDDALPAPDGTRLSELRAQTESHLAQMVERCAQGTQMQPLLVHGVPHSEIVAQARELGADLIVMGTHGRTGLKHLLVGSVAERVLRTSPVPVLTLRKPGV